MHILRNPKHKKLFKLIYETQRKTKLANIDYDADDQNVILNPTSNYIFYCGDILKQICQQLQWFDYNRLLQCSTYHYTAINKYKSEKILDPVYFLIDCTADNHIFIEKIFKLQMNINTCLELITTPRNCYKCYYYLLNKLREKYKELCIT